MKTKIGERTNKPKVSGVKGFLKAYPGAVLLLALIVIGGIGFGAMSLVSGSEKEDETVLEQKEELTNTNPAEQQEEQTGERIAKTLEEAGEELLAAGAQGVEFEAEEDSLKVHVILDEEVNEEEVGFMDAVVRELLSDDTFVQTHLFEETEENVLKSYAVQYWLGEDSEEASYTSAATYSSSASRKGGMLYLLQKAWSGPDAVVKEEEATEETPNNTTAEAGTTTPANNSTSENQTQGSTQENSSASNSTQTTENTESKNELTTKETEESIASSSDSLKQKAKKAHDSINSDIIGWINIPNTKIDLPVTHTSNNSYYMNHNIYKQYDNNGAILADYECNFSKGLPTNTILYGHNWHNYLAPLADENPNDIMFDEVHKFADADFAAKTPYIYFSTTSKDYKWQVFAAFYTNISWTDYIYAYPNSTKMSNIISTAKSKSLHNYGVSVSTSDKILTLSTCTRMMGNNNQYRFVVMAKLVG